MTSEADIPTQPAKPRRRGRWRRRLLWFVGFVVVLLLVVPLLAGIAPIRSLVADKVGKALGRRVEIGSLSAYWFKGIDVEDVTIHSPDGFDGPLATIAKIHADLSVPALVQGRMTGRVRIVHPHVTLRRDAQGVSNAHDLGPKEKDHETAGAGAGAPPNVDLRIVLVAGTVEALDAAGKAENALRDIQFRGHVKPDGSKDVDLQAAVEGAGKDGGNARIALLATVDDTDTGVFKVDVPPLRLERVARMAADTLEVSDLAGTIALTGNGTLHPNDTLSGTLSTRVEAFAVRGKDGTQLSIHRIQGDVRLRGKGDETEASVTVEVGDLRVARMVDGHIETIREPEMTLRTEARFTPSGDRVRVASGTLDGGSLMNLHIEEAVRLERGAEERTMGLVKGNVQLGRLGSLRGLFPTLEPLAGGTLTVTLQGSERPGFNLGAAVIVENLVLRPCEIAPDGYEDRRMTAAFRIKRVEPGVMRLRLTTLDSSLARLTTGDPRRGVAVTYGPGAAYAVDGNFDVRVRLANLSRLLTTSLGLAPGERVRGTLHLTCEGSGTTDDMRLTTTVRGSDIIFPASWSATAPPATFEARVVSTRKNGRADVKLSNLSGLGLSGGGNAQFSEVAAEAGVGPETTFQQAEAQITVDLASARPWLGGVLKMDPGGRLGGRARLDLHVDGGGDGQHVTGSAQANDLFVLTRPGTTPIREKRVTVQADVALAPAGGKHVAKTLTLDAGGLRVDLDGSTLVAEPDIEADMHARLSGDAAQLAPTLAAFLGAGYEDLRGEGPITGSIDVTGSPAEHGRTLLARADLVLGSWTTSGLSIEKVRVKAARADVASPLKANLLATVGGGSAQADLVVTMGGATLPWTSDVHLAAVDTSSVVIGEGGLGRYLAFALPALVPADAGVPVLSGRLDADLHGASTAIHGDALADGLTGKGTLQMAQGEVKQSTLFGGGDGRMGKLVGALRLAVPAAGQVLAELQKAVAFSALVSTFTVAGRVLTVQQTKLTGERVVIDTSGTVGFDETINLKSRVVLQGKAGQALAARLPDGAIPLKIGGTLDEPRVGPDVEMASLLPIPGKKHGKGILDKIKKKLPKLPKLPKFPKIPKPKLPKLPNPFK